MASDPPDVPVPYRRIRDSDGRYWDLWEIGPAHVTGGGSYDRRNSARAADTPDFLLSGWLCFESDGERRRFAPIPYGWEFLSDDLLQFMLSIAEPVKRAENSEASQESAE